MAEDVHNPNPKIQDDGKRLKFRNKGIRLEGSSHFNPRGPQFSDHFIQYHATPSTYYKMTINGATTATGTASVSGVGGFLRMTTAAGADSAASGLILSTGVTAFEPDKLAVGEKIAFEARLRTPTGTTLDVCMGLHDAITETSGPYVIAADSTVTTGVPTDFAGFTYSSTPTSGVLNLNGTTSNYIGIINSCNDTDVVASTGVMNDLKFHIFRVEVNSAGDCTYFVDDVQVYKQLYVASTTGLTPTVPLAGTVAVVMVGQAAVGVDVDYFTISGALDLTA